MFLGVDGGGTKTAFCLLTREGEVAASAETRSSYYFTEGIDLVPAVLREGIDEICRRAGIQPADIAQAFFGLPSYGEVLPDVPILDEAPAGALGHRRYSCDNDMVCGWAGSLGMTDGINVIAGTGSMTYGENEGRKARCGGWGEVFGDEGSAYWIAVQGLGAFSKMSDGRLPRGPLLDILKRQMEIAEDLEVVDVVLNRWKAERGQIAALSRTVVEAAEDGDEACRGILRQAAGELVSVVEATRIRLDFAPSAPIPVSYSGGVFRAGPLVMDTFEAGLDSAYPHYDLRKPLFSPVIGAALYAAKQAGQALNEPALERLKRSQQTA